MPYLPYGNAENEKNITQISAQKLSRKAQRAFSTLLRKKLAISVDSSPQKPKVLLRPSSTFNAKNLHENRRYITKHPIIKPESEIIKPYFNAHHYKSQSRDTTPTQSTTHLKQEPITPYLISNKINESPLFKKITRFSTKTVSDYFVLGNQKFKENASPSHKKIKAFAYGSRAGKLMNKVPKQNQDEVIVSPNFYNDYNLFGVADGHGISGKQISCVVKYSVVSIFHF